MTSRETVSPTWAYVASRPRVILIPFCSFTTGFLIGVRRGARLSSLRFLAENAHRAPRTLQGWYLYKKTKNYRVMWGALKGGCRDGIKITAVGSVWVTIEELCRQAGGINDVREVVAGAGSAMIFVLLGAVRLHYLWSGGC